MNDFLVLRFLFSIFIDTIKLSLTKYKVEAIIPRIFHVLKLGYLDANEWDNNRICIQQLVFPTAKTHSLYLMSFVSSESILLATYFHNFGHLSKNSALNGTNMCNWYHPKKYLVLITIWGHEAIQSSSLIKPKN